MPISTAAQKKPEPRGTFRSGIRLDPVTVKAVFIGQVLFIGQVPGFEIAGGVEFGHSRTTI